MTVCEIPARSHDTRSPGLQPCICSPEGLDYDITAGGRGRPVPGGAPPVRCARLRKGDHRSRRRDRGSRRQHAEGRRSTRQARERVRDARPVEVRPRRPGWGKSGFRPAPQVESVAHALRPGVAARGRALRGNLEGNGHEHDRFGDAADGPDRARRRAARVGGHDPRGCRGSRCFRRAAGLPPREADRHCRARLDRRSLAGTRTRLVRPQDRDVPAGRGGQGGRRQRREDRCRAAGGRGGAGGRGCFGAADRQRRDDRSARGRVEA